VLGPIAFSWRIHLRACAARARLKIVGRLYQALPDELASAAADALQTRRIGVHLASAKV
jgi:hypothetical protein